MNTSVTSLLLELLIIPNNCYSLELSDVLGAIITDIKIYSAFKETL